ncbi:MAG: hypothetical protein HRU33_03820 [Rhodobacteraceae bacterium]|nr:hypothetical protein [Paracoccaceae bacterium]
MATAIEPSFYFTYLLPDTRNIIEAVKPQQFDYKAGRLISVSVKVQNTAMSAPRPAQLKGAAQLSFSLSSFRYSSLLLTGCPNSTLDELCINQISANFGCFEVRFLFVFLGTNVRRNIKLWH